MDEESRSIETRENELLEELIKLQKKTANRQLIATVCSIITAVAFVAALFIVVPKITATAQEVSAMVGSTEKLIEQAQGSLGEIDGMVANVNKVVVDNTQSLTDAVGNIQNIDIDNLNQAIQNLSDAAEPLAKVNNKLSGIFGGF